MNSKIRYNLFILISSIGRNIIEFFSLILLYNMGYSIKDILLFLVIISGMGIISNSVSIYLGSYIGYKYILIISSVMFGFSYYYLSIMDNNIYNLIILSICMSFGNYMYHSIRHLMALCIKNVNVSYILIYNYLGIIISSFIGSYICSRVSLGINILLVIIISLVSIIPIMKINYKYKDYNTNKNIIISKKKILYYVLEQFKVVFCELEGIYIYLYIDKDIMYLGVFNIIMGISSIIVLYYFNRYNNIKYYKYINIMLCIILLFRMYIENKYLLYIIYLLEGLFIREFDYYSSYNLYDINKNTNYRRYLFWSEIIFCISKAFIYLLFYLFIDNIYVIELVCILGIFMCSFIYPVIKNIT